MNDPPSVIKSEGIDMSLKSNKSSDSHTIIKKRESTTIPLNNSKEEVKETLEGNNKNISEEQKIEELGVIIEEQSEHSTIVPSLQNRKKVLTQKSSNYSKNEFTKSYTRQISNTKLGFLAPGLRNDQSKNSNNLCAKTIEENNQDMKDLFNSLSKLSVSDNDIKEVSEEFSKATDSQVLYPQNVSSSSQLSKYNKHLNYAGKNSKQCYPSSGLRWEINDSGIQSISNITNYINPEENKANEGMIQSVMINNSQNASSNKNEKLEQSLRNSINKQQSRIIHLSDKDSDVSQEKKSMITLFFDNLI